MKELNKMVLSVPLVILKLCTTENLFKNFELSPCGPSFLLNYYEFETLSSISPMGTAFIFYSYVILKKYCLMTTADF